MVNITRPTTVKRVVHNLNVSRSGVEINKIIPISKITRPGPLKKVSGLQRATEKYKNYQVIKKDNVTEFRAPKTVQYLHSYDKDAPTGTKKSYDVYSPKSVFVNKSGNVIKEVERGVQKFDVGGGSIGKIYDARVVDYGNVDGYKTKEEQTFRTQENKILPYQTNYYVDDTFVGRDWGTYAERAAYKRQEASDKLQQKRSWREQGLIIREDIPETNRKETEDEAIKRLLREDALPQDYLASPGAYDFSGVQGKDTSYFDKELKGIFKTSRRQNINKIYGPQKVVRPSRRTSRPKPTVIQNIMPWGLGVTREAQLPGLQTAEEIKLTMPADVIKSKSGVSIMSQPTNFFSQNLGEKIYGKKKNKIDVSKLI